MDSLKTKIMASTSHLQRFTEMKPSLEIKRLSTVNARIEQPLALAQLEILSQ
jgi:hypothetical protein